MKIAQAFCLTIALLTGHITKSLAQTISGSLPVVLVGFDVSQTTNNNIAISWTTQQEVNIDYFAVEKSNDGINWGTIATAKSKGNSALAKTYNSIDIFPLKGSNFYRVAIKSQNGLVGFTATKTVRFTGVSNISIYPNPSTDLVNISLAEVPQEDWIITLVNNMGNVVAQKKYNRTLTSAAFAVGNYPNGNYRLQIAYGKYQESKQLMIKHN